ncbi:hypothetical protein BN1723_011778 [Verticillium longisporum]|uniref:Uncharacterized protein n=1 Tax=Verticillium longisporum TaxID=100787 RepID=A0A0G4LAT4_VERLO|nr:hypothetical protein BN1723_011778 [Verticillium longisporum]CRK22841.1 hypothetical protein BN1708_013513 [Verticillium longisporum]
MSIDIWPPVSPEELKVKKEQSHPIMPRFSTYSSRRRLSTTSVNSMVLIEISTGCKARELAWILEETRTVMTELKHGLDGCYALLAPIDPGSTLVLSTHRNEKVKGHITRVGTRIVKGTIHLQLRTLPTQSVALDPQNPIHIPSLEALGTHLSESVKLLALALDSPPSPRPIADHLRALSISLAASTALLRGPPLESPDPSWQHASWPQAHFAPPLPPNIAFHLFLQEATLVLALRALEPADAPQHFGLKLGLALGTYRRLEHDEMDHVYPFRYSRLTAGGSRHVHRGASVERRPTGFHEADDDLGPGSGAVDVYVREKVRVETADPSLLSLYAKLLALGNTLAQARRNLAAVMGEELDD